MAGADALPGVISIHALREEGDTVPISSRSAAGPFLSTPSARRATRESLPVSLPQSFLSTPSARRATPERQGVFLRLHISIHALREEGDSKNGENGLCFCMIIKHFV